MKALFKFSVLLGVLGILAGSTQKAKAQYEDVSLQTFYDELSPYGTWINDPDYGYVWRPDVDQGEFRPYYTNGRWVMTEYGNTWVSNYEWGWAPFHYGRWVYHKHNRWMWVPDTVWGPAWVTWRSGGGYYGWAPLGVNISIHIGRAYVTPNFYWNFIPAQNIYHTNFPRYYSGRNKVYVQNTVIINNTYIRNNRTYYTGPRADDIRRATNRNVTVYNIARTNRTGGNRIENNQVNIYTPRPSRGNENTTPSPRTANINNGRTERNSYATNRNNGVNDRNTSRNSSTTNEQREGRAKNNNRSSRQNVETPTPRVSTNRTSTPRSSVESRRSQQPVQQNKVQPQRTQPRTERVQQRPTNSNNSRGGNESRPARSQDRPGRG